MRIGDRVLVPATEREVRVSPTEARILFMLMKEKRELYGYEIMKLSNGEISLASVYSLLGRLEGKGLVTSRPENITTKGHSIPRRWYRLTPGVSLVRGAEDVRNSAMGKNAIGKTSEDTGVVTA